MLRCAIARPAADAERGSARCRRQAAAHGRNLSIEVVNLGGRCLLGSLGRLRASYGLRSLRLEQLSKANDFFGV